MDVVAPTPAGPRTSLTLVGDRGRGRPGREVAQRSAGLPGDICVFFEPSGTVVRLYGRVDTAMRKELVEAALDVVDRGEPVTIDIAPDAEVHPGTLRFLQHVCRLGVVIPAGWAGAATPSSRGAGDPSAWSPRARAHAVPPQPSRRRLPLPRAGTATQRG